MVDSGPKAEGQTQDESGKKLSRREFLKLGGLLPLIPAAKVLKEGGRKKEGLMLEKERDQLTDYGFEIYGNKRTKEKRT